MEFITFIATTIIISLSGVMAPGPMSAITIGYGTRKPHSGAIISLGHGIIEFPLMLALFWGVGTFLQLPFIKAVISLLGGIFLLIMGISMFRARNQKTTGSVQKRRTPLATGILMSAGNPYFLIWWATIGFSLIINSTMFGWSGFIIFAIVHWLCDFIWLWTLSYLSFKGGAVFGRSFQTVVFVVCSLFLIFFSGKFLLNAYTLGRNLL